MSEDGSGTAKSREGLFARRRKKLKVPIGLEKLLCRAAGDGEFRSTLMTDREGALKLWDPGLSDIERQVLASVPDESLIAMINRIDLSRHAKRRFMKAVATATFVAAAGTALYMSTPGCSAGTFPDMDIEFPADQVDAAKEKTAHSAAQKRKP